jgi:hypothetical protein
MNRQRKGKEEFAWRRRLGGAGDPSPAPIGDALTATSPANAEHASCVQIGGGPFRNFQRRAMLVPPLIATGACIGNWPGHTPHQRGQKITTSLSSAIAKWLAARWSENFSVDGE